VFDPRKTGLSLGPGLEGPKTGPDRTSKHYLKESLHAIESLEGTIGRSERLGRCVLAVRKLDEV